MYVIHTKGFQMNDKLKITREYLLPDIYNIYHLHMNDIIFSDEILINIIPARPPWNDMPPFQI